MNTRFQILYPLLLGVALALGLFIGMGLGGDRPDNPLVFRGSEADKFSQVVRLVDAEYVDSVEMDGRVDVAIQDFLQDLDPHSYYITAAERAEYSEPLEGNFDGIGIEFRIVKDTVMVVMPVMGGPSEKVGIQAGDRIVTVNDSNITGISITNKKVMELLRGERGTTVDVSVQRRGKKKLIDFTITRGEIPIQSIPVWLKADDETGYIRVSRFARTTHDEFKQAFNELGPGLKRIVVDLRGNGGGYLQTAIALADEFLGEGEMIVYTEGRNQPKRTYMATDKGKLTDMEVILLINEGSASASEILAGAIQDNDRGTIIGRRSFGKGLVQDEMEFKDKSAIRLTIARYFTPSGRCIQKPYGEGVDYEHDYMDRLERGELLSADSIALTDSIQYRTKAGRTVYGGGGIMPDVFVPIDTSYNSEFFTDVLYSGVLNQFSFDYADSRRDELGRYKDAKAFNGGFTISAALFNDFLSNAAKEGFSPGEGALKRSEEELKIRLKAGIARVLWGEEGYFTVILKSDREFQKAMTYVRSRSTSE
ncbi:MAG: S41 family peptidase [Bacteroidetes bacterium]|nr:S41 family peptidase [Bacteroidota bacterium]